MWNLLRSRSLLHCDWIVFTHQQAGVSKKKCRGQLLRLGAIFFSRPTIIFCWFFFLLFLYTFFFFFFICPEDACKNSNNNSKEGTQNGRWWMTNNAKWQWRFELRYNTDDPLPFPRENHHRRFFVSLRFSQDFFRKILVEKRAIKSLE